MGPSDTFSDCVQTCDSPCAPTPSPSPSSCSCGCTGDDLKACVEACPDDKFTECVQTCNNPCAESCTGGDDGQSLHDCVSGAPLIPSRIVLTAALTSSLRPHWSKWLLLSFF